MPTCCPQVRWPDPPAMSRTSTPTRNWRRCSPKLTGAATARRSRSGTGVLQIRDAKGGKDRQVPVSEPLRIRLADYHAQLIGRPGRNWFFPGRNGLPLTVGNIDKNFRRFLWQARISHGGRGRGPRVHDLRHTFAVNNFRFWFAQGQDVGALLPVLQTCMGHSSLRDTAYYLRLTAESYPDITARVQQATGDVVPPDAAGTRHGD